MKLDSIEQELKNAGWHTIGETWFPPHHINPDLSGISLTEATAIHQSLGGEKQCLITTRIDEINRHIQRLKSQQKNVGPFRWLGKQKVIDALTRERSKLREALKNG